MLEAVVTASPLLRAAAAAAASRCPAHACATLETAVKRKASEPAFTYCRFESVMRAPHLVESEAEEPRGRGPPLCRVEVHEAPDEEALPWPLPASAPARAPLSVVSPFLVPGLQLSPGLPLLTSPLSPANRGLSAGLSFPSVLALSVHPKIQALAAQLRKGVCVAFPTETVYGLGALATDARAVADIFRIKGRPSSDPLICHVLSVHQALQQVVDLEEEVEGGGPLPAAGEAGAPPHSPLRRVFEALGAAFWPGPLSLIAKQRRLGAPLPSSGLGESGGLAVGGAPPCGVVDGVTGGTGFVAVRVPCSRLALALLAAVGAPVAAPSANRFGCISPTKAQHVISQFDIKHRELQHQQQQLEQHEKEAYVLPVLDGGECCAVGIESTVAKLLLAGAPPEGEGAPLPTVEVRVLRRGLVSPQMLSDALQAAAAAAAAAGAPPFPHCFVSVSPAIDYAQGELAGKGPTSLILPGGGPSAYRGRGPSSEAASLQLEGAPQESPGLCLKHYSPRAPSFLLQHASRCFEVLGPSASSDGAPLGAPVGAPLQTQGAPLYESHRCVVVDGNGALAPLAKHFSKYVALLKQEEGGPPGGGPPDGALVRKAQSRGAPGNHRLAAAAANQVFAALHAAEEAALQQQQHQQQEVVILLHAEPLLAWGEEGMAVFDRLFRQACKGLGFRVCGFQLRRRVRV
ncbi:hypothetical protein Emag_006066 [Eimeria magna]